MAEDVSTVVREALAQLNSALRHRDASFSERFHPTAVFVGSEPGELARGRAEITALLAGIFSSPATVQFDWHSVEATGEGTTAWFYAEGEVEIVANGAVRRRPYQLTGILAEAPDGWRWRLFHGSEPWIDPAAQPVGGSQGAPPGIGTAHD